MLFLADCSPAHPWHLLCHHAGPDAAVPESVAVSMPCMLDASRAERQSSRAAISLSLSSMT